MKKSTLLSSLAALVLATAASATTVTDTVGAGTGFFAPSGQENLSPYYRYANGDWGWSQGAVTGLDITSATITIGNWDVDSNDGEVDEIYVWHNGAYELLGNLTGTDGDFIYASGFSSTTFVLGSQYFADIAAGLQLWLNIDATRPPGDTYWAMSLTSATLTVEGTATVPDSGSTLLLAGSGLAALLALARRR